jgi:hypothetical protein
MKRILLAILGTVASVIILVSLFDFWANQIPIRWMISAWILLLIIIGSIRLMQNSEIKDIRWALKKSTKILKQQRIGNKADYWLVRQILYKHQYNDLQVQNLYSGIKALDLRSEDLNQRFREVLNRYKSEGLTNISLDDLYDRPAANNPDIIRKYERGLLSWGLKREKSDIGIPYYDLKGYVPF